MKLSEDTSRSNFCVRLQGKGKGKAIPLQARTDP
jgi:hypothetical protein